MLTMEVVPGKSVGSFILGMPLSEAIAFIQQKNKVISHVELKYNEMDPLSMDIILDLIEDGVLLRFEPKTQKLRTIEIYDVPKVTLSYAATIFSGIDKAPTLVSIYERFGPTHPGVYEPSSGLYILHYPTKGLSFSFPIPKKFEALYLNINDIPPMEFPDRTTPLTCRIYLYSGSSIKTPELPPTPPNSLYFEEIIVKLSEGIRFSKRGFTIDFHSTTQDVLSLLGTPSRIFYKEEDKMKIHTSSYSGLGCADYFYNYFTLGIDILFDVDTHIVKKFILHTNFPSHYEFNQYVKCNFKIVLDQSVAKPKELHNNSNNNGNNSNTANSTKQHKKHKHKQSKQSQLKSDELEDKSEEGSAAEDDGSNAPNVPNAPNALNSHAPSTAASNSSSNTRVITPDHKWNEIQELMGPVGKPVVHNRGSNSNPFGATLFYGYKDIIFEVMRNNHIASVCLIAPQSYHKLAAVPSFQ